MAKKAPSATRLSVRAASGVWRPSVKSVASMFGVTFPRRTATRCLAMPESEGSWRPLVRSAERERECLNARIEELDFEDAVAARIDLADQLVQALGGHRAVAGVVDVHA